VERTVLGEEGIALKLRAAGSEPMHIAQVQVDGAYWRFEQEPAGRLCRGESARVRIPYYWLEDELHEITFVTNTGVTFGHIIEVATATPRFAVGQVLGLYVGVLPVPLGVCSRPALCGSV